MAPARRFHLTFLYGLALCLAALSSSPAAAVQWCYDIKPADKRLAAGSVDAIPPSDPTNLFQYPGGGPWNFQDSYDWAATAMARIHPAVLPGFPYPLVDTAIAITDPRVIFCNGPSCATDRQFPINYDTPPTGYIRASNEDGARIDVGCPSGYNLKSKDGAYFCYKQLTDCLEPIANKNSGPPRFCPIGNPANPATGNKYQVETDYRDAGVLAFTRYYNSNPVDFPPVLGAHWRSGYDARLLLVGMPFNQTVALVYRPEGNVLAFTQVAGGWRPDTDVTAVLTDTTGGWQLALDDGSTEDFDVRGRLIQRVRTGGRSQSLSYGPVGLLGLERLTAVRDDSGRALQFGYDDRGWLTTLTTPAGDVYTYERDGQENLVRVGRPDGTVRQYHYNEPALIGGADLPHALTGITDERGIRYATFGYDAQGRASLSTHAGNAQRVDISYNDTDGTRVVT
ncbi:MAG TPA: RHS repeat protein, partial [Anaerolineae bacterium]|nr:RHS repeat protein [Anaerolineae bacterium]